MTTINGVLGPIEGDDLGFTLMHEHVLCCSWSMRIAFDRWIDRDVVADRAVEECKTAIERGVRTMVDLTPINLGRDIHLIREVAERSGMQIIAATGLYYHEEPWMKNWPAERLVEYLIDDIEKGIQGTDAKAGIIKCATDHDGVTPSNEKLLRVAAKLHKATGTPISTHTDAEAKVGLGQLDVFEDEGVDLSRVVIGHCGDSNDMEYLEAVLSRGCFIGMDRFGIDQPLNTDERVATIAELARRGWADKMVLSHDACAHMDWFPPELFEMIQNKAMPNWNYRHIPDDVLPALRKAEVGAEQIEAFIQHNPRRVLLGESA
jgi:phosphotriesterase-related protein